MRYAYKSYILWRFKTDILILADANPNLTSDKGLRPPFPPTTKGPHRGNCVGIESSTYFGRSHSNIQIMQL